MGVGEQRSKMQSPAFCSIAPQHPKSTRGNSSTASKRWCPQAQNPNTMTKAASARSPPAFAIHAAETLSVGRGSVRAGIGASSSARTEPRPTDNRPTAAHSTWDCLRRHRDKPALYAQNRNRASLSAHTRGMNRARAAFHKELTVLAILTFSATCVTSSAVTSL
jgi:hypothetical protein